MHTHMYMYMYMSLLIPNYKLTSPPSVPYVPSAKTDYQGLSPLRRRALRRGRSCNWNLLERACTQLVPYIDIDMDFEIDIDIDMELEIDIDMGIDIDTEYASRGAGSWTPGTLIEGIWGQVALLKGQSIPLWVRLEGRTA